MLDFIDVLFSYKEFFILFISTLIFINSFLHLAMGLLIFSFLFFLMCAVMDFFFFEGVIIFLM